jgi:DNA-binding IclR family transcriptional regulator
MARPAPAATRAVDVISFLTAHPARGFTLSELVRALGMNVASAHATLAVLDDTGFVVRDPIHRTYILGPALAAVGFATMEQHPAIDAALEQADALSTELNRTILVAARAGRDAIFVARRGPAGSGEVPGYPGDKVPLKAPVGAVFVAWATDGAIEQWLERAAAGPAAAIHYRGVLGEIRSRGYAVPLRAMTDGGMGEGPIRLPHSSHPNATSYSSEVPHGPDEWLEVLGGLASDHLVSVRTIAAPIFDAVGQVQLALSITGGEEPMTALEVHRLGQRLMRTTDAVTKRTRGIPPSRTP